MCSFNSSLNNLFMLPTQPYRPGVPPPPHLSPFVDDEKEGYVPTRQREINQLRGDVILDDESEEESDSEMEEEKPVPVVVAAPVAAPKKQPEPVAAPKAPLTRKGAKQVTAAQPEEIKKEAVVTPAKAGPAKGDADSSSDEEPEEKDVATKKKE